MALSSSARKGMSRILDGIMKYRQTLRPSLLEEFQKVATGPSVKRIFIKVFHLNILLSLKVFY